MKKIVLAMTLVLTISGCATQENLAYYTAQERIAIERTKVDVEKYKSIAVLSNGSDAARVAGVMALALGGNMQQNQNQYVAPPKSTSDTILQYLSVLAPVAVQAYGIGKNADVAINSANMARDVSLSTNQTFQGIASRIQAPGASSSTVNTLSGTGTLGSGAYNTADNHSVEQAPAVVAPVVQVVPTVITPVIQVVPTVIEPVVQVVPTVITPVISTP